MAICPQNSKFDFQCVLYLRTGVTLSACNWENRNMFYIFKQLLFQNFDAPRKYFPSVNLNRLHQPYVVVSTGEREMLFHSHSILHITCSPLQCFFIRFELLHFLPLKLFAKRPVIK